VEEPATLGGWRTGAVSLTGRRRISGWAAGLDGMGVATYLGAWRPSE
jgi:hypothetical protein